MVNGGFERENTGTGSRFALAGRSEDRRYTIS